MVDDSASPLFDLDPAGNLVTDGWISSTPRTAGNVDVYVFGCGLQFRQCLQDFTLLAGPIGLPPLSGMGVWWSRHWGDESGNKAMVDAVGVMTEEVITTEVLDGYESRGLPLHILVLDMEWHEQMEAPDCTHFLGKTTWGGYSWNTTLFSDPQRFVDKLHASRGPQGIKLSLNYHPDAGVDACQKNYKEMALVTGVDPTSNKTISDIDQNKNST